MCKITCSNFFVLLLLLVSSAWADDPIQIKASSSPAVKGPLGCPSESLLPPINVRLYSLKTSSGLIFYRKSVTADQLACFEAGGSQNLTATNIKECAQATEYAGLKMYRWEANICTGYSQGIPKGATCLMDETVVLYSVDIGPISLTLYHSVSSIWAEWKNCLPYKGIHLAKFELTWRGTTITLNETTFGHRLKYSAFCTDDLSQVDPGLKEVTLAAFDASNTLLMKTNSKTLVATPVTGLRFLLNSGNCLYYDNVNKNAYDVVETVCRDTLKGTMFIANKNEDVHTYGSDLFDYAKKHTRNIFQHFVGLRKVAGQGEWKWLSGLPQSVAGNVSSMGSSPDGECAEFAMKSTSFTFYVGRLCNPYGGYRVVCHEYST